MTEHLFRHAHDRGFKDFQRGNYYTNPFPINTWKSKEWLRGQNAAYFMYLERNLQREGYKKNSTSSIARV